MRFQAKRAQVNDIRQILSTGSIDSIAQGMFKILTHDDKNKSTYDKNNMADYLKESEKEEIRTLEYLENCANATRGTEAYDQYEWLNDADE
jgi:hypothetical protein